MARAASLPNSIGTQRTSILDLDSGTWVRNVIFSRLDDNLVGRSVDHPHAAEDGQLVISDAAKMAGT